ncbi:pseudouridylate synthase RPUSD2 [Dendropsophus ebraccatus]|uniref:pseudouridylate synthase RPUSD2 n=1 Tax=Dendropsophus ebraccatus TaxID=150705 RepID=UPI0038310810
MLAVWSGRTGRLWVGRRALSDMSLKPGEPAGEGGKRGGRKRKPRGEAGEGRYVPPPTKRRAGVSFGDEHFRETESYIESGLRKVRPYYFDFETYCKGRWVGRSLLDVFSKEFRSEPLEYYRRAARAGRLRLNHNTVTELSVVLKDNDFLRNTVHRHEPPVTAQPLGILAESEDMVVVDKPSSLPVHPCGRFRHNTVIFILGKEHNMKELHTIHRLDRLTSGVLMFAKTSEVSKKMAELVRERKVEKEYVCRVCGEFPEETVTCEEPILVVSYKIGVCRVHPKGKASKTVFQRLSYNGRSSVVKCFPYTGRTHQIRVHLQYLGHPIVNDPIYNTEAWGPNRGKGGAINKTDEELLRTLIEEHKAKQSLDILDVGEDDLVGSSGRSEEAASDAVTGDTDPAGTPHQGADSAGTCHQGTDSACSHHQGTDLACSHHQGMDSAGTHHQGADPAGTHQGTDSVCTHQGADLAGTPHQGADSASSHHQGADPTGTRHHQGTDSACTHQGADPAGTPHQGADSAGSHHQGADPTGTRHHQGTDSACTHQGADPAGNQGTDPVLVKDCEGQEEGVGKVASGADTAEKGQGLVDPLCGECKLTRPDPSPKDLIMYLHALRYKGEDFDYSTELPEWAKDHWTDD